jgi:hypothetical protein
MMPGTLLSVRRAHEASRAELVEAWEADYGAPPPKGMSTRLLRLSAAYNAQVREYGGLRPAVRKRLLAKAVRTRERGVAPVKRASQPARPTCGTRLVREWNGRSHIVDVHDGHITYDGQVYRSLSAVARAITGARWSGPRFFGLT